MATHTFTGTATDTLAAVDTDTLVFTSTASAASRVVTRSLMANRVNWGSVVDGTVQGPTFSDATPEATNMIGIGVTSPPDPVTVAQIFTVLAPCRFTGCRIYKAPNAVGTSIPVRLWSGVTSGTTLATETIASWVVDDGGWQQVTFATPIDLDVGTTYVCGYLSADGIYAYSAWVFNAQDTVVWPIVAKTLFEVSGVRSDGNAAGAGASITFPTAHNATNYYIDIQVEWDDPLPGYSGGTEYFDQWSNPQSTFDFPVGVFFADPPNLAGYQALGINTLIAGFPDAAYIAAMNALGNDMDWYPYINPLSAELAFVEVEEPDIGAQIRGFQLDDEPDMSSPYRSPDLLRSWSNFMRQRDSTKPMYLNMGKWAVTNQSFAWSPTGASPETVNQLWRDWAELADIISCDQYSLNDNDDPTHRYGVWAYASQVGRMRELTDDRKPVWLIVETTSQTPAQPTTSNVRKAVWAGLIAGARGLVFFDHRFASDFVTQDFAAMLNDSAMSAAITALATRLQSLGEALLGADTGLVTEWTSSNVTSGPQGGTFGVPMHYTTRADAIHEYLFAQGIRAGATTATFTVPSWAGDTLTVLDESRTVVCDGSGVFTDTFAADFTYHLYQH
jgi:hypothetical protein